MNLNLPDKFAATHTWIKGPVKGKIAIFVDDLLRAGGSGKQSGMPEGIGTTLDDVNTRAPRATLKRSSSSFVS
eukprot:12925315-Prorocentrum_lima.AAC.1